MTAELLDRALGWEGLAVTLAILYLLLVVMQNIWCWAAALASTSIYLVLFYRANLYMESALQVFYLGMAIYGWLNWRRGGPKGSELPISLLGWRAHLWLVSAILLASAAFGWLISRTDAALPWLDSFTTVAAVVATWMVARKIFENWFYWFVIDSVSIYLYVSRDLPLTAILFGGYLVMIVIGSLRWWRIYQQQPAFAG